MGSLAMKQPEMQPLIDLKDEGLLYVVRVYGCQLGYFDEETNLPFAKPMEFWTTMTTLRDKVAKLKCTCKQHAQLLGTGKQEARPSGRTSWIALSTIRLWSRLPWTLRRRPPTSWQ